jgi:thioredoxin-related protein
MMRTVIGCFWRLSVVLAGVFAWHLCLGADNLDAGWTAGPSKHWFVNWNKALAEAKKTQRPILVLCTGSDWCGWCIKLHKEVFEDSQFKNFARKHLVLLYLDRPSKKALPNSQALHNKTVSDRLHFGGGVPNVRIFSPNGRFLGEIVGYRKQKEYLKALREILKEKGEKLTDNESRLLFSQGYSGTTSNESKDSQTTVISPEACKAKVTGVALVKTSKVLKANEARANGRQEEYDALLKLKFQPPETKLQVPSGYSVIFRIKYKFPPNFQGSLGISADWESDAYYYDYCMSYQASYPRHQGKGELWRSMGVLEERRAEMKEKGYDKPFIIKRVAFVTVQYDPDAEPAIIGRQEVNLEFLEPKEDFDKSHKK